MLQQQNKISPGPMISKIGIFPLVLKMFSFFLMINVTFFDHFGIVMFVLASFESVLWFSG